MWLANRVSRPTVGGFRLEGGGRRRWFAVGKFFSGFRKAKANLGLQLAKVASLEVTCGRQIGDRPARRRRDSLVADEALGGQAAGGSLAVGGAAWSEISERSLASDWWSVDCRRRMG